MQHNSLLIAEFTLKKQRGLVHAVLNDLELGSLGRARLSFHGAKEYFHEAVRCQEAGGSKNHQTAKSLLAEAEQLAAGAETCVPGLTGDGVDDGELIAELKDDIYHHR
jgi:hypothetical protein